MSTILLTGASGFLGSAIAKALLNHGDHVVVVKRQFSNLWRLMDVEKQITFYNAEDLQYLNPFEKESIDAVIHTATSYGRLGESKDQIYAANLHFPVKILELASAAKVKTFVNIDTVMPPDINPYSLSKNEFFHVGKQLADRKKVDFINVRLEHLYGPNDDGHKFVQWLLESCLKNVPQIALTSGLQRRDFIYVTDAADGVIAILDHLNMIGEGFQEFALGGGSAILMQEFIKLVHQMTSSTSHLGFGEHAYRTNEPMLSQANLSRMTQIGWKPKIDLKHGIQLMIESYFQKDYRS
jgi:nucleoside-diphosphate-sugar epimerase